MVLTLQRSFETLTLHSITFDYKSVTCSFKRPCLSRAFSRDAGGVNTSSCCHNRVVLSSKAVSYLVEAVSCVLLYKGQHAVLLHNVGLNLTPFWLECPAFRSEDDVLHRKLDRRAESVVHVDRSVDHHEAVSRNPFRFARRRTLLDFLCPMICQLSIVLDFHRIGTIVEKHQDPLFPDKEV